VSDYHKISLIGAGNVSTHLCKAFHKKGNIINQIFSRKLENASMLAQKYGAEAIDDLQNLESNSDLYFICVNDDAIPSVAASIAKIEGIQDKLIVHTSGFSSSLLLSGFKNFGVFWPLQSFSKKDKIKLKRIPICIHANSDDTFKKLKEFSTKLSKKVFKVNDEQRSFLHISAVFANNFSNRMFAIAYEIAEKNGMNPDLLKPLIYKTSGKLKTHHPKDAQTGPARRNDLKVLKAQMKLLQKDEKMLELYQIISKNIRESYSHED
jgi:predicted short-subunit dehydrogenase-like oxidoreductase (DUF2520 family)